LEGVDGTVLNQLPLIENVRIAHPCAISLSLQLRQGRVLADDDILTRKIHEALAGANSVDRTDSASAPESYTISTAWSAPASAS